MSKKQGVYNNMKKFSNMLSASTIVKTTLFLSLLTSIISQEVSTEIDTDVKTLEDKQAIPHTIEGESPPIDEFTNMPVVMTAVPLVDQEVINEYVVQEGDSLSKIATGFVLDIETLKKWNNLVNDTIMVGQTLSVNGQVEPTAEQLAALEAAQRRVQVQQSQNQNQNNSRISAQASSAPVESAPTADASNLIAIAQQYLGAPYSYGGKTPSGFDCSGYVSYVFKQAGKLSSYYSTIGLYNIAQKVSTPQVGDLVFFSGTYKAGISHVGIYLGNNLMINAAGNRVQINNIYDSYWGKHFTGFGRI